MAKNTIFLYFRMILVLLVTLYTSRVVLKVLGFEDYGIYNLVGSVIVFFGFFKTALTNATYRYIAYSLGNSDGELNKVYSMAINCHILLGIILFIILEIAGVWFINNHLDIPQASLSAANWTFQLSLLTFFVSIIQTPFHSNIIAHEKMDFYAYISIIEVCLKLLLVLLLIYSPINKLISYSIMMFIVSIMIFICYIVYCKKSILDTRFYRVWDKVWIKRFSSYSGWGLFVNVADVSTQQSLGIFFNWFIGLIGNTSLGISNQVNSGINMFVFNFSQAYNPQIIKSYAANNKSYFMNLIFSMSKISFLLYVVICLPIAANINYILKLWLGDYPPLTASLIQMTMLYYLFDSFQIPLWQGVHATGNIKTHQLLIGCIKFFAIPSTYFILKYTGNATLALGAWGVINGICAIVRTIYVHYLYGLDLREFFLKVNFPIIIVLIIATPITYYLASFFNGGTQGLLLSSISCLIVLFLCAHLFLLEKKERTVIYNMVRSILNSTRESIVTENCQ